METFEIEGAIPSGESVAELLGYRSVQ